MNKAIKDKALEINELIKNDLKYQRYLELKNIINELYRDKEDELKLMQQDLVKLAFSNRQDFEMLKGRYYNKRSSFYNDPLINEYIDLFIDIQKMIYDIKDNIEKRV